MGRARSLSANLDMAYAVGVLTGADNWDLAWAWLRDAHQKHTNAYLVEQSGRSILEEWEDEARGGESICERAARYTGKAAEGAHKNRLLLGTSYTNRADKRGTMEYARFADFPREVVWHIFTLAARSSTSACKTLCLVNSWCYRLLLPYLFTTAVLPGSASVDKFLSMVSLHAKLNGHKTAASLDHGALRRMLRRPFDSVRNLWMLQSHSRVWEMMALCYNAEHVAMDQTSFRLLICETTAFHSWIQIQEHQPLVGRRDRPLQILIVDANILWNKDILCARKEGYESPPAIDITHIRLAARGSMLYSDRMLDISPFPRLTHFAIPLHLRDGPFFRARLKAQRAALTRLLDNSTLQMLVCILVDSPDRGVAWEWIRGIRKKYTNAYLVQSSGCPGGGLQDEWESEVRGGESVWEKAVKYTQKLMGAGCSVGTGSV
ncbi:hypothetical protein EYR40_010447 [Pleurotus pulmonarius]|nr:hypothetical protein EYR40_010447 [Pleurotus pulmonarius]